MATIELTGDNFASHVADDDILFVDFWASWCGPCQQFAPTYEAASEAHPDITFGSINTEEQRELASAAGIRSIPTLMVFREGVLVFSQPGALPPAAFDQVIDGVRGLDMQDVHRQVAAAEAAESTKPADQAPPGA
ncbi:thioredoxin family protein [Nocardioides plantarum]|uniref:Thioredoxin family protein n=1 Tax=Nocardioides plantarum TaxID=29299 RepID=A0ABV5KA36_9ACTN|nr:thioredoxin domain-containing protein [Nocardioides plantarum]